MYDDCRIWYDDSMFKYKDCFWCSYCDKELMCCYKLDNAVLVDNSVCVRLWCYDLKLKYYCYFILINYLALLSYCYNLLTHS